ncbi:N-acyl amino acid synthase FeeM domain-containing protein [Aureliella helgolandensis]|uniref:N-acyl amino acid synthase FeeM catalytic core domain-containing protein n=1 Tax=Aureliella helgolandensis TaxID=2527968 RepID=A0A518GE21_9BACT|nr:hypothetical protein [Aureliella helgolandensis]QDV26843.1 hypothetical protein Q31a_52220 [Aureliella helgolandensis]
MRICNAHSETAGAKITCRLAHSREDFCNAFRLLHQQYCAAGLCRPNPSGMRISPQQLQPESQVIVAEQRRQVVGTVSLTIDSKRQLPLENIFGTEVRALRTRKLRLLEVGCLAATGSTHRFPSPVYAALTRAAIEVAQRSGTDRMIAAVHPRHSKFYERSMGFQRLSQPVAYEMVEGQLAVCVSGSPNSPGNYRNPWRRIFFEGPLNPLLSLNSAMLPFDRAYFSRLLNQLQPASLPTRHRVA